jgi:hypothetical protein
MRKEKIFPQAVLHEDPLAKAKPTWHRNILLSAALALEKRFKLLAVII